MKNRKRAFTLLEVLVSIALMMALVGSMMAFFWDMLSTRRRALEHTAMHLAAATLVERVESDLMSCLVGDNVSGAGIEGDGESLRILSRTVAAHLAQRGPVPEVLGDLQRTEYRFDAGDGLIEARRLSIGESSTAEASFVPLGGGVHKVRFRYHDSRMWRDTFNSLSANRLPLAVEVAVWFDPWPGEAALEDASGAPEARLTYDADGGFDEAEYARLSDSDFFEEPRPDRIRVILIPDAAARDPYAAPGDQEVPP